MAFVLPVIAAVGSAMGGAGAAATALGASTGVAGAVGTAATWLSAGMSVLSGIQGMRANKDNAQFAKMEAKQSELAATEEANRTRRIHAAKLAEINAMAGAQGTTMEGSPLISFLDSAKEAELDAQSVLYQGKIAAFGKRQEASIYKKRATNSLIEGIGGAVTTLGSAYGRSLLTPTGTGTNPNTPAFGSSSFMNRYSL